MYNNKRNSELIKLAAARIMQDAMSKVGQDILDPETMALYNQYQQMIAMDAQREQAFAPYQSIIDSPFYRSGNGRPQRTPTPKTPPIRNTSVPSQPRIPRTPPITPRAPSSSTSGTGLAITSHTPGS